jgi:dihydropteroate synthase
MSGKKAHLGERTLIMGVLNVTPDSFSDGGLYFDSERAIEHGVEMANQGADWIDVGGESTRPGSKPVTAEEELRRVLPVIRGMHKRLRALPISIDTTKAEVAEQAARAGASIINDVSGLRFDPRLAEVARRHRAALILMHIRRHPETMQRKPFAKSIWRSLGQGLARSVRLALSSGLRRSQLIIDPGLGFGKTRCQNFEIVARLHRLRRFGLPILLGASRKSFVQAIVAGDELQPGRRRSVPPLAVPKQPLTVDTGLVPAREMGEPAASSHLELGNAAMLTAAILEGVHIVRVHDVQAALPAVRIADALLAARTPHPPSYLGHPLPRGEGGDPAKRESRARGFFKAENR